MSDWDKNHRPVATWIPIQDYDLLQKIARDNKVKIGEYLRAIIVDALQEERAKTIVSLNK